MAELGEVPFYFGTAESEMFLIRQMSVWETIGRKEVSEFEDSVSFSYKKRQKCRLGHQFLTVQHLNLKNEICKFGFRVLLGLFV